MGAVEDENEPRWDPWPKVVLYLIIFVIGGAFLLTTVFGYSVGQAVFLMGFNLALIFALSLWRRRSQP